MLRHLHLLIITLITLTLFFIVTLLLPLVRPVRGLARRCQRGDLGEEARTRRGTALLDLALVRRRDGICEVEARDAGAWQPPAVAIAVDRAGSISRQLVNGPPEGRGLEPLSVVWTSFSNGRYQMVKKMERIFNAMAKY